MGNGALHGAPRRGARRGEARDSDVPTEFSYEIGPARTICSELDLEASAVVVVVGSGRRPHSVTR